MILMRGNIVVILLVAILCPFHLMAEIIYRDVERIDKWRKNAAQKVNEEIFGLA